MRAFWRVSLFLGSLAVLIAATPAALPAQGRPLVLVHYMPWFQAPPVSSAYGWHWHMGFTDPYAKDARGNSPIASHYYPLTGPYDSADPILLEYQTTLMKASGIDGVIVDWYGVGSSLDYPQLHKATQALFQAVKKAGLLFAICYEDQTLGHRVEAGEIAAEKAADAAAADLGWAAANWFSDAAYVKVGGRPVLLDFGPQYLVTDRQWKQVLDGITPRPFFVTLDRKQPLVADAGFPWPPMGESGGKELSAAALGRYLDSFYKREASTALRVATAFPGFHDFYKEAGVAPSYGYLDARGGDTFKSTLDAAVRARPAIIQIATWNDYGEGTVIEPTVQNGFRDLIVLQELRRKLDPSFAFGPADLGRPLAAYKRAVADRDAAASAAAAAASQAANQATTAGDTTAAAGGAAAPDPYSQDADLSLHRPVASDNHIYQFVAANAVDGDVRTYWEGAANAWPDQLTVDLGADHRISAIRIRLNPNRIWQARTQRIAVAAAADGQDLAEVLPAADYRFDPVSNANTVTIPLSITARLVSLTFTADDGATGGQVAELEVLGR